jgi:hypothetical protein
MLTTVMLRPRLLMVNGITSFMRSGNVIEHSFGPRPRPLGERPYEEAARSASTCRAVSDPYDVDSYPFGLRPSDYAPPLILDDFDARVGAVELFWPGVVIGFAWGIVLGALFTRIIL